MSDFWFSQGPQDPSWPFCYLNFNCACYQVVTSFVGWFRFLYPSRKSLFVLKVCFWLCLFIRTLYCMWMPQKRDQAASWLSTCIITNASQFGRVHAFVIPSRWRWVNIWYSWLGCSQVSFYHPENISRSRLCLSVWHQKLVVTGIMTFFCIFW